MKNMKVSLKLVVSFAIMIAVAAVVGVMGFFGMSTINSSKQDMYYQITKPLPYLGMIQENLQSAGVYVFDMVIHSMNENQAGVASSWDSATQDLGALNDAVTNFRQYIQNDEVIRIFDAAMSKYENEFAPVAMEIHAASQSGTPDDLVRIRDTLLPRCLQLVDDISSELERCVDILIAEGETSYQQADSLANLLLTLIIVSILIAVAVAIILTFYLTNIIAKPITLIDKALTQIGATGKLTFDENTNKSASAMMLRKDEIGDCARGFQAIINHLQEIEGNLSIIADGDLSIDIHALSPDDSIANSLNRTLDSLNAMFSEINTSSHQVSAGSKQIADGAQSLAQGSTQQAASVEELSASIGEIAQKTKENALKAERAATLASTIMQNAEKGSNQMSEMTTAVQEINQASQSISKVIKVIDDIAFQTNILALNAAVEAARAGQHG